MNVCLYHLQGKEFAGFLSDTNYKFDDKERILDFIRANPDADGIAIRDAVAPKLAMSTFYDTLKRMEITFKKRTKIQRTQRGITSSVSKGD